MPAKKRLLQLMSVSDVKHPPDFPADFSRQPGHKSVNNRCVVLIGALGTVKLRKSQVICSLMPRSPVSISILTLCVADSIRRDLYHHRLNNDAW